MKGEITIRDAFEGKPKKGKKGKKCPHDVKVMGVCMWCGKQVK